MLKRKDLLIISFLFFKTPAAIESIAFMRIDKNRLPC